MNTEAQKRICQGVENIPDHPGQMTQWPPPWLRSAIANPTPIVASSVAQNREAVSPGQKRFDTRELTASTELQTDPEAEVSDELEGILHGLETEVRRLTTEPLLIQAATNLIQDCRAIWHEGNDDSAMLLARDFARRIPAYIVDRTTRWRKI